MPLPSLAPILLAALAASAAPEDRPVPIPVPAPPVVPPTIRSPYPDRAIWPPRQNLEVLSGPDWSDYHIYPPAARRADEEGAVVVEDLVGTDGIPKACRIVRSSGYGELDSGTCDLFMQMRFAPPRDALGRPAAASFIRRIVWLMTDDARPFVASGMAAELELRDGRIVSCNLTGTGPFLPDWSKSTCPVLGQVPEYYLGRYLGSARRATIFVDLIPQGAAAPAHAARGRRLIASRHTDFELKENGDPTGCRSPVNSGFGAPREDHASPCGFFMTQPWFEKVPAGTPPRKGAIEVKVFLHR
jgi:TonB family protein